MQNNKKNTCEKRVCTYNTTVCVLCYHQTQFNKQIVVFKNEVKKKYVPFFSYKKKNMFFRGW